MEHDMKEESLNKLAASIRKKCSKSEEQGSTGPESKAEESLNSLKFFYLSIRE